MKSTVYLLTWQQYSAYLATEVVSMFYFAFVGAPTLVRCLIKDKVYRPKSTTNRKITKNCYTDYTISISDELL